jgi:hypothetical protein
MQIIAITIIIVYHNRHDYELYEVVASFIIHRILIHGTSTMIVILSMNVSLNRSAIRLNTYDCQARSKDSKHAQGVLRLPELFVKSFEWQ